MHSHKGAKGLPSNAFDGLRSVVNIVRGCKIVLTRNVAYLYGLARGTRGKVVGVIYGPGGIGSFPEAILVDAPEYCGPGFYPGQPTWGPLLAMTIVREGTGMMHTQFPILAGFALAVNKAQGLTIKEGVVIPQVGGKRFTPAAKHGLPFVACTRSASLSITAFKTLPAWDDFVKGRDSDMLRMRIVFAGMLQGMHSRTPANQTDMNTPEQDATAHERWMAEQAQMPT
ncbi:hypothetical protein N9L19_00735 [bacterium]|nr:hypothetical protein [bacterium]